MESKTPYNKVDISYDELVKILSDSELSTQPSSQFKLIKDGIEITL